MSSVEQAWRLIAYSSAITVAGALIIYVDVIWNALFSRKINILKSRHFMVASLALSGGVLITTALHSLLANAAKYFRKDDYSKRQANQLLLVAVVTGIVICTVVNLMIHMGTSKSIVHCAHEHNGDTHDEHDNGHSQNHQHSHASDHSHLNNDSHTHSHSNQNGLSETSALLDFCNRPMRQYISAEDLKATGAPPIGSSLIDKLQNHQVTGECRGFESIYHCAAEIVLLGHPSNGGDGNVSSVLLEDAESGHTHAQDEAIHHHHVVPKGSELLSIGMQTAFAITIHKLPEGFMIYATERNDTQVGLNVFVALAIHNFFEGFAIACPLYLALENRFKAVVYASLLSAGSQPLGALFAEYMFSGQLNKSNYAQFGFLIAGTAGFMITIALQMLTSAVSFSGSPQLTLIWSIIGIVIVLASNCI